MSISLPCSYFLTPLFHPSSLTFIISSGRAQGGAGAPEPKREALQRQDNGRKRKGEVASSLVSRRFAPEPEREALQRQDNGRKCKGELASSLMSRR